MGFCELGQAKAWDVFTDLVSHNTDASLVRGIELQHTVFHQGRAASAESGESCWKQV